MTQGGSSDIPFFHLESIIAATDGFSVANKLGQGGFGPVYKVINTSFQYVTKKSCIYISMNELNDAC